MDPLVQLVIIWAGCYLAALLAAKTRLTSVLFYLAIGALFVNFGILPEETTPFIRGFSELGIILTQIWRLEAAQGVSAGQLGVVDAATLADERKFRSMAVDP